MNLYYILPENDSFKCPVVISLHTWTPFSLVSLFGGGNVVEKSLSLLTAHCPEILWEEVPVTL